MSDLTFDFALSVVPLDGCALATALGAAALVLAGLAVGLAAGLTAAGLEAAAGLLVSAIRMTPFEQLGAKEIVLLRINICIAGALVNYSTANLVLKSICRCVVAKSQSRG
jgi:hypothetical protein